MIYSVILAFGDSLTFGARDGNNKSWPQYLAELHSIKVGQPLIYANEGVNGETVAEGCKRFYPTLLKYPMAKEVVFMEGTNDSKPNVGTLPEEYRRSLNYVIEVSLALERHLYLMTIPGLCGYGSQEYDKGSNVFIKEYNGIIRVLTQGEVIELSDMNRFHKFYADGCHMNSFGYREIARRVLEAILRRRSL